MSIQSNIFVVMVQIKERLNSYSVYTPFNPHDSIFIVFMFQFKLTYTLKDSTIILAVLFARAVN